MPMFKGKTVPQGATHYMIAQDQSTLFMRRHPENPSGPSGWQGFFNWGMWSDMNTGSPVKPLPFWALNHAELEAQRKKMNDKIELNSFYGRYGGITECSRKFFEHLATYGHATMSIDQLIQTPDSDKKLDAAIHIVKLAVDDLVKARDTKPRVRMSAVGDDQRYIHTIVTASPDLKITVGTSPSPSASKVMTAKACGTPYQLFIDHGWTDEQLIEHGYMAAPRIVIDPKRPLAATAIRERETCERTVKFQTDRNLALLKEAKEARESKRQAEKYTKPVKLCHLNLGDLFMVPPTNMNEVQLNRWCGKLLKVVTTVGDNPNYTSGQFGLYGCRQKLRALDMDTYEPLEMPHLSTLVWRC